MSEPLRVLIVEDAEDDCLLILREIEQGGFDVHHQRVETAREMRRALDEAEWDAVIADYSLPQFDAPAALEIVHERDLDLPFIVASGTIGEQTAVECMRAGAHDYIMKDNLARLAPALERELGEAQQRRRRREAERQRRWHLRELSLIQETVVEASRMDDGDAICRLVADGIQAANEGSCVAVSLYDRDTGLIRVCALSGDPEVISTAMEILGRPVTELTIDPDEMGEEAELYTTGRLEQVPGGLYSLLSRWLPPSVCEELVERLPLDTVHTVGFALGADPYGGISISLPEGREPESAAAIEAIASHISVLIQRRQAEGALRESEARYRTVFENTGTATCLLEEDGTISLANDRFSELAGYSHDQLQGEMKYTDFIAPHEMDRMTRYHRQRRESHGKAPVRYEFDFVNRDGETRRVSLTIDMIPGTGTSVASLLDITERKQAVEALRESERRFRRLADMLPQIVFEADADGTLIFANRNAFNRMSYTRDEFDEGLNALDMIAPEDRERAAENMQKVIEGRRREQGEEYTAVTGDGERFPVLIYTSLVTREGEPTGLRGIIVDITERTRAQEEVRRLSQFQEAAIDQANIWLNVIDSEGNVQIWNRAAEQISGYPAEEVVGRDSIWERLYPDEDYRREVMERIQRTVHEDEAVEDGETTVVTREGEERVISWNSRALVDEHGESIGLIALGRDVTEQRELEEQLRQAQKMEAVGQLAGGVAHDFNNMLTVILGNAQLLRPKLNDEELARHVDQIVYASRRSEELTGQLLAFGRQQTMSPEPVSLNSIVEDVAPMLQRIIPEDIEIQIRLADDLEPVQADPSQMEQAIVNLCINARDAMPEGGQLVLATQMRELTADDAVGHPDITPGTWATVIVSDTGTGMDADTREKVFDPFFTTKEPGEGTGLGLSTVYGIVTQSGGSIEVESEPGEGTTFTVFLPLAKDIEEEAEPEQRRVSTPVGDGETILVVEDEESLRGLVREALSLTGYEVIEAENGMAGLRAFEEHADAIDLIITDVVMPEMSGPELIASLDAGGATPPVLFVSGYTDEGRSEQHMLPDSANLLEKPFEPSVLVQTIGNILGDDGAEGPQEQARAETGAGGSG